MVAFKEHHSFNGFKHLVGPVFGLLANLAIMLFYLIGPFMVSGMSWKELYIALTICAAWVNLRHHLFLVDQQGERKRGAPE